MDLDHWALPARVFVDRATAQVALLLCVLAFLSLLAYISFLFAYRLVGGRKYSDGTYLPPWTFAVIGGVMLFAQLMAGITQNEWKLLLKGWPVTLMMFAASVAAYSRTRRKKKDSPGTYGRPPHGGVGEQ